VYFELIDLLGETVKLEKVPEGINFTHYAISDISSGVYEWRLRDNSRVIKIGKIVIVK
jgi:hypothetical protein